MKIFRNNEKIKKSKFWINPPYDEHAKKDTGKLAGRINLRMKVMSGIVAAVMVLLVIYIAGRAALTNTEYEQKALSQMNYSSSTMVAKSGEIYDANMTPIAVSNRVYILILDPKVILETDGIKGRDGTLEVTAGAVAQCFGLDEQEIIEKIQANPDSMYLRFVAKDLEGSSNKTLVTEEQKAAFDSLQAAINSNTAQEEDESESNTDALSPESSAEIEDDDSENVPKVVGVWFETEYQRYYPYNDLSSKVIGFTTKDSTEGIWGLEKYYNEELRGTNGRSYSYINSSGNLETEVIEPTDGYSIVSTIDINLTKLLSDAVEEWYAQTDENGDPLHSVKEYNILAMDPSTGAVKAMVTSTDYDLNDPTNLSSFYTEEEIQSFADNEKRCNEYEALKEAEDSTEEESLVVLLPYDDYLNDNGEWNHSSYPTTTDIENAIWRNGIISNSFEPGSTGKIITYAAALEEGIITKDTIFDDSEGYLQIGSTIVKCHNYSLGGCGVITAMDAVAQSCNVAFIEIGEMLGAHNFVKYQMLHNLGQKTGIDLPGEASCEGLLFSEDNLGELELATNAFGQCYNVTMIQMAAAFCADINGGYYYRPYTVQTILDQDGNIVESVEPTLVRQVISEETSAIIRDTLEFTVTNGTAYGVQVADRNHGVLMEGYHFGGKTGTAQKLPRTDNKYIISLISAAPMDSPKLVLYVVLDEYEGELDDDGSAPVQYLSGILWNAIKDYIGLYSELDPDVNSYEWRVEAGDDGLEEGEAIMSDAEGNDDNLPVPPEDDSEEMEEIVDLDSIINPEDALVVPMFNE